MITMTDPVSQASRPFLTDGGLETTLIFHKGIELPEFAAFHLLRHDIGRNTLRDYFHTYLEIAAEYDTGFILESPTWRANPDWARKIGYSKKELIAANKQSIADLESIRNTYSDRISQLPISGCIGPRGDGYSPSSQMSPSEAESYHDHQVKTFADANVDLITAMTLNYVEEAIGIVNSAMAAGIPSVISFTLETDGALPSGEKLGDAIRRTDADTNGSAAYFMINCAHPTHFEDAFDNGEDWSHRIKGIRANASTLSHEELDNSETLDDGDPADLADRLRRLKKILPNLTVYGGCCGTDHRHVRAIGKACTAD
ncbi:MAG: homocysteine S-methyltransferase family protein [Verrucomicrobiota bacterium]